MDADDVTVPARAQPPFVLGGGILADNISLLVVLLANLIFLLDHLGGRLSRILSCNLEIKLQDLVGSVVIQEFILEAVKVPRHGGLSAEILGTEALLLQVLQVGEEVGNVLECNGFRLLRKFR